MKFLLCTEREEYKQP